VDKILKIKLVIIGFFFLISTYNYKLLFVSTTKTLYFYENVAFMVTAICFGVILSASIYNFALYVYNKDRQYIYYSIAQLSTLFFLINLDSLYISPFDEIFGLKSHFLFDLSQIFMLFFSVMFIKEFLNVSRGDKLYSLIRAILALSVVDFLILLIFKVSVLSKFIPIFIPIWLILSEAKRVLHRKDKPFYFLIYGWGLVLFVALIEYAGLIEIIDTPFPFLHITFALESLILSLAISYKFKLLEDERRAQQTLLLQQSRLASMGEMVATIAHQWRQPLTHLSYIFMNIKKQTTSKIIKEKIKEANQQLKYMSNTIDDFRNFYNPSKSKELFSIQKAVKSAMVIARSTLSVSNIEIKLKTKEDFDIFSNQNEFEQVILNIIINARDALVEHKIQEPKIKIVIQNRTIYISDNAKGIDLKYKEKIFEPYFSTKIKSDGIGLYIAKTIIEKEMSGKLSVKSSNKGTTFIISL
jgi:signal transduction histidine kinase